MIEGIGMYIGEIAQLAGTSPKAVRHYESLGLLGVVRRVGTYRVYSDQALRQIKLIKQAQTLGFRLSELAPALVGPVNDPDWLGLMTQIDAKRVAIRGEIHLLRERDGQLRQINEEIRNCLADELAPGAAAAPCDKLLGKAAA